MASAASQYATTVDTTAEMDPHYAGDEQAADYYPTPESVVHIGAHATHVTVHVHAYAPPPAPPPVPSSSVDVDVRHEHLYSYAPNPRPTSPPPPPPPPQPTPNDAAPPSAVPTPPRTTNTTATRSVADTLGDTLAALPDGLLSPTVRAVVQQVLRRASEPSSPDDHAPANTVLADVPATATRLGQRGQNVAISLMMQPLSADGSTTSLTDLFQQLNSGPNTPVAAQGVPLGDLNRHTEVVVHEPGRGLHDTCAVCQEPLEPGQVVRRVLSCGHTFHHTCLDQWLEANATCPMCMQPVVPSAVDGRSGADEGVGRTGGMPPPSPPPPPPPLHPPPPRVSSTTSATDHQGFAYSPRTTAVVQQVDALLASDGEEDEEEEDPPSRVRVRSVEVRRIPIRLWRTTAAADTGGDTSDDGRQRQTVVDRILASALDELTLDTIEEDGESGESDDGIAMV